MESRFSDNFEDNEDIVRCVLDLDDHIDYVNRKNHVSPALFKDERGCSVGRTGPHDILLVKDFYCKYFMARWNRQIYGFAELKVSDINGVRCKLLYKPRLKKTNYNIYHSEIHESDQIREISPEKTYRLAKIAKYKSV